MEYQRYQSNGYSFSKAFPSLSASRTARPGQQESSLNSNYHHTVVFESIPHGIKRMEEEGFMPCRKIYVLIYIDEMIKNVLTGRKQKKERIAVGEILDVREMGVMKTSTKKMKNPQLERRYTSKTGECLIRWFSLTSNGRSEMKFESVAPRLQEWKWWRVESIEATISPCLFTHSDMVGGSKSITTKRGGKQKLDEVLSSIRLENPQKEILWK
jgi:hypothetical protein